MENLGQSNSILKLVNLARGAYGANNLETLLRGQPHSASFCTIGRSLRNGVEDWLFVAIGSKYLRLWASGRDSAAIAQDITAAWGIPNQPQTQPTQKSGCATLALPLEVREFLNRFDCGLLPDYEGEVSRIETRQLSELARAMPLTVGGHERFGGRSFPSILGDQRCVHPGLARFSG